MAPGRNGATTPETSAPSLLAGRRSPGSILVTCSSYAERCGLVTIAVGSSLLAAAVA